MQKALYAKNYGYSLKPIPARILIQAYPPKTLPIVGDNPVISARQGRAYKPYYPYRVKSRSRRRKRPPTKRGRRPPSSYGLPVYATKYKNYIPSRRPPSPYRYKKKRRPYRGPPRRPPVFREPQGPPEFDEYEQEIPDDYDDYDHRDGDYSYFDIPSKRLPLEYDKEFLNRHADLYNAGFNPGVPRVRPKDVIGQYTDHVRTRVRYQSAPQADHLTQPEKVVEESQESLWPGEVQSVHPQDHRHSWHDSAAAHTQPGPWHEEASSAEVQSAQVDHEHWHNSRPPRTDNQWHVYNEPHQHPSQAQPLKPQQFQWPPRPTRSPDLRGWTTSLRPKPLSAAVAVPSRPVVPREQREHEAAASHHHPVYNWDPTSNTYKIVEHGSRPRYQAHYSEADFYHQLDRKGTEARSGKNHRGHRAFSSVPDIGFGEGMEVVDDGVAGWKVKK